MDHSRWIYIPASLDAGLWSAAISKAATEAGVRCAVAPDIAEAELVITHDLSLFLAETSSHKLALFPPYTPVTNIDGAEPVTAFQHNMHAASHEYAAAAEIPQDVLVVGPHELRPARVRLFDKLDVVTPHAAHSTGARANDIARAFSLFERGRPQVGDRSEWSPLVFNYEERAIVGQTIPGVMDLTGRPRIVVYGPYITLPRGLWRAKFRFSLDKAAATRRLRFDWGTQHDYAEHYLTLRAPGVYELQMDYYWAEAAEAEARILVMEGVFEGAMDFLGVDVELISLDKPATTSIA